jgi:hypothetical protein
VIKAYVEKQRKLGRTTVALPPPKKDIEIGAVWSRPRESGSGGGLQGGRMYVAAR